MMADTNANLFDCDHDRRFATWENIRDYTMNPAAPHDPYLYLALYGPQDQLSRLIEFDIKSSPKTLCKVEWQDTYILQHHLPIAIAMGYTPIPLLSPSLSTLSPDIPHLLASCHSQATPINLVQWLPSYEPRAALEAGHPATWPIVLKVYLDERESLRREGGNNPYADLSPLQQQGIWETTSQAPRSLSGQLCRNIKLSTAPIHPDMDIKPTGQSIILPHPKTPDLLCCYSPLGHFLGIIQADTAGRLWELANHDTPTFTQHVHKSLLRDLKATKTTAPMAYRPPQPLVDAALQVYPSWTESCSSALTHHPHCSSYLSLHQEDTHLGAKGIWSGKAWSGFHILVAPKDPLLMAKLLRWALASALTESAEPLVTLVLFPTTVGYGAPWVSHPYFHHLATLPRHVCRTVLGAFTEAQDSTPHLFKANGACLGLICNKVGHTSFSTKYQDFQSIFNNLIAGPANHRNFWRTLPDTWEPDPVSLTDVRFVALTPSKFKRLVSPTANTEEHSPAPAPPSPTRPSTPPWAIQTHGEPAWD